MSQQTLFVESENGTRPATTAEILEAARAIMNRRVRRGSVVVRRDLHRGHAINERNDGAGKKVRLPAANRASSLKQVI